MNADSIELLSLIGENKAVFKIPVYQRNYEWKEKHIRQLFSDLEKIVENDFKTKHFLGTIVFVTRKKRRLSVERILIDGQQRVTTTIIILKAIYDCIKADSSKSDILADEILETYLENKHVNEESKYKLKPVKTDESSYYDLMNNQKSDSNIYKNYVIVKNLIDTSKHSIEDIFEALMNVHIVYIDLDDGENPQIIFESLNSTGLSLTQADLIRNFILMGLDYDKQTRYYEKYWVKIEELLTNKIISNFVRDYLTMRENNVTKKNRVYEQFKYFYRTNDYYAENILAELLQYANFYDKIINESTEIANVNNQLSGINTMKSTVTYPYILEVFNDYYEKKLLNESEFSTVLKLVFSYIFRRYICNVPTNSLNKVFSRIGKETRKKRSEGTSYIRAVEEYLLNRTGNAKFPRDIDFKNSFFATDIYKRNKNIAKMTLYRIEEKSHKELVEDIELTIEHIMPQTLTPDWNIELGSKALDIHSNYKHSFGNLTLTKYNSEISNKNFLDKKLSYKNSNFTITRKIAENTNWGKSEILKRAENLFNIAQKIWYMPEENEIDKTDILRSNEEYSILDDIIVTGRKPKTLIIDNDKIPVRTWKEMLLKTCEYLIELSESSFYSLMNKSSFSRILKSSNANFVLPYRLKENLYIETNYSAQTIINYIIRFTEEYEISDLVYFKIAS